MAAITIKLPRLAQAMELLQEESFSYAKQAQPFSQVFSWSCARPAVSFAGTVHWTGTRLEAHGTISIGHRDDVCVYQGEWLGEELVVREMLSDQFTLKAGKICLMDYADRPSYHVLGGQAVDGTHAQVAGSTLELPLVPGEHIRVPGPDGEYLELDVETTTVDREGDPWRVEGLTISRFTRSFTVKNSAGQVLEAFLDVWPSSQQLRWVHGCAEKGDDIDLQKFLSWFSNPQHKQRNLLRSLDLQVPVFPKTALPAGKTPLPVTTVSASGQTPAGAAS